MDQKHGGDEMGGGNEQADARMGMIQVNDLVYKLDTDLSVSINRTHKTQYFQNSEYTYQQTATAILNSGADYIDPRRSFFSFDVIIPQTLLGANIANPDYQNAFVSAYLGKNGSILNIIDSVVVSSRSGDELSRVNDYAQLMNLLLPEMFGPDWRDSIGQEIGMGSLLGGSNDGSLATPPMGTVWNAPSVFRPYKHASEQRRIRFAVPLYLLSPIFNYGRLLPSMLMSGLRIEIKWKSPDVAFQQMWEGFPMEFPTDEANSQLADDDLTDFKTYLGTSSESGAGALDNTAFPPSTVQYEYKTTSALIMTNYVGAGWFRTTGGVRDFQIGDKICFSDDGAIVDGSRNFHQYTIRGYVDAGTIQVSDDFGFGAVAAHVPGAPDGAGPAKIGAWRLSQRRPNGYQRDFNAPVLHGKFNTPVTPITTYSIKSPEIAVCCIQLTDAIQRTLNEFSSINGLEIVYADYDRTSIPIEGISKTLYAEVRKSASRALAAFARVVSNAPLPYLVDSFASAAGVFWNGYQWQLGSLYFPQQRVENRHAVDEIKWDNVLALMYSYTQDAFDRYHPKAAPTMATMRGTGLDFNKLNLHPTEVHAEHNPSTYLAPYSEFGKWGSFVNGGTTVATTLERSTIFDLSGIPINNSRVLALNGDLDLSRAVDDNPQFRALLFIFLKYVRLARVFLVNCEVEQ